MEGDPQGDRLGARIADGRYRIERLLGAGGMGEVYAAIDTRTGAEVAIKLLHPRFAEEQRHLLRFRREAEVMGLLDHPHVVGALASGVEPDGTPYLVMELVPGVSLSAYMRARGGEPLDVSTVVSITRQIVSALCAAVEIGVIHRDLKPGNVMIMEEPDGLRASVLDFGLARFLSSPTYRTLTLTGQILGTPAYMAPEQAFGDRADTAADVFSVGAIMHALLTGSPPFGRGPEVLVRLMANDRTPLTESRPDIGPLAEVIERCLAPSPEDRYRSATDLDRELARFDVAETTVRRWERPPELHTLVLAPDPFLDEAPAVKDASPDRARPDTSAKRSRAGPLVGAALVAFAIGVVAVVAMSGGGADESTTPATPQPAPPSVEPVVLPAEDGASGVPDASAVADVGAEPDASSRGEASREVHARHCDGETTYELEVSPPSAMHHGLASPQIARGVLLSSERCYSTASVATTSVVEFEVGRTGRLDRLRFTESGRLNAAERACVLRSFRERIRLDEARAGEFVVHFADDRMRVTLTHSPACGP